MHILFPPIGHNKRGHFKPSPRRIDAIKPTHLTVDHQIKFALSPQDLARLPLNIQQSVDHNLTLKAHCAMIKKTDNAFTVMVSPRDKVYS